MKISLQQRSYLRDKLTSHPFNDHFHIYDEGSMWDVFEKITYSQYKYILALTYQKKYFDAKKFLDHLGVKHKKI